MINGVAAILSTDFECLGKPDSFAERPKKLAIDLGDYLSFFSFSGTILRAQSRSHFGLFEILLCSFLVLI
jgi:hypothetical protein